MGDNRLIEIQKYGQRLMDFITRDLMRSGNCKNGSSRGIAGMTSNPTIFAMIGDGTQYDDLIKTMLIRRVRHYLKLAIADIQAAADVLLPV